MPESGDCKVNKDIALEVYLNEFEHFIKENNLEYKYPLTRMYLRDIFWTYESPNTQKAYETLFGIKGREFKGEF